jgi:Ran GTPase-activating protein (RanGAP) involved in mRNA processing and transport
MPSLKQIDLHWCNIDDDGFVALMSALERITSLQILNMAANHFGERGFTALAESPPNIKGLQQINITDNGIVQSIMPS